MDLLGWDSNPSLDSPIANKKCTETVLDQIISFIKVQFKRPFTPMLFGLGTILIILALFIGISDNLPGITLVFLGVTFSSFSMIHHWREARLYGTLLAVSAISFPVLVLLHNIFDGINQQIGEIIVLNQLLEGLAVISFLAAIFLAPTGIVIGIFAGLFYLLKKHLT
ncbi:MAG: hypothetical protein HN995_01835 [Candidatus Marinimicrobia bacterium]|mgnify:FL=1|nr:hypothetical protein [Candidatus Neomarinimicrobiota bacterium]MBT3574627.1 hypothetical protein [Candidatus Neomarinimicrobiota bacterium]MBT3680136.1 hypothetical protein [Candidatus Neomarinimicrobiota bacterium]MBT3951338.1 hypothetical protein [Candidatus Neomarinimicrobiota bacterium]MBT4254009.1 hypothetical protein [Candidatus Neomarinimicrobiota bacterium]